jgi:peptidoglycan/LPS O-acetylase OafA/YrhL
MLRDNQTGRGMPARPLKARVTALDGLRGIAAMTVVLGHAYVSLPQTDQPKAQFLQHGTNLADLGFWLHYSPLRSTVAGAAAVILFFVLSGYAITLAIKSRPGEIYAAYAAKRFVRLYGPFAFAISVAAGLYFLIDPHDVPSASNWFNLGCWHGPLTWDRVLGHFTLSDHPDHFFLDGVIWSLIYEIRIALIFPLIVWLVAGDVRLALLVGLGLHVGSAVLVGYMPANSLALALCKTLYYVVFFVAGCAMATHRDAISRRLGSVTTAQRVLGWCFAAALFCYPDSAKAAAFIHGGAAILVIALSVNSETANRIFRHPVLAHLGKISFSLYLIHLIVFMVMIHLFWNFLPLAALVVLSIGVSILVATLMHFCVEAPFIALSHRVAARIGEGRSHWQSTTATARTRQAAPRHVGGTLPPAS